MNLIIYYLKKLKMKDTIFFIFVFVIINILLVNFNFYRIENINKLNRFNC